MSNRRRLLQFVSSIVILTMLFSGVPLPSASAQGKDGLKRQVNPQTGKVSFIGPESGRILSASRALGTFLRPQNPGMALAKRFGAEFGLKNPERDLKEMKTHRDAQNGRLGVRYQQKYQDIPVMGGELIVNTNENGDLYSMNGEVSPDLSLSTQPTIDSGQARQTALQAVAKWYQKTTEDFVATEPELWIYDESLLQPSTRPAELVWRMEVTPKDPSMAVRELVLINAQRGNISLHFNQVDTAWSSSRKTNAAQNIQSILVQETTSNKETTVSNALLRKATTLTGATWYVATTGSDANSCTSAGGPCATINGAIGKAAAGDTIKVAIGTYTSSGTEAVLIDKSIILSGGWNSSFAAQTGSSIVDGQDTHRCIKVNSGVTATIERFVVQNGSEPYDGAAGIWNDGNLTINYTTIKDNAAASDGGGILNLGTFTLNDSIITGNTGSDGGGIANGGYWINTPVTVFINNSTISQNTGYRGGGLKNGPSGIINLNNATLTSNETFAGYLGAGILNEGGVVTLQNTILAGNTTEGLETDCYGNIDSHGYNLIGNNSDCTLTATTGDKVGTSANPIDPRLTLLQNNGGLTLTHALKTGSPAIDAGNPAAPGSGGNTCLATDQRGTTRPVGGRCDIGAYEGSVAWSFSPLVKTYTGNNTTSLPGTYLCDQTKPNCTNGINPHADAAHKYAIGTYNLYANQYNRNSMDNQGMTIISTVHYSSNYDNAFWSGTQMVYGDAYGYPLADDVVAHELTHGVTQYESNLFYYYQSGAINESFSDLWGEYYDQTNGLGNDDISLRWLINEDVAGMGAIRNMSNPPQFGDPDKMSSPNYYLGDGDSGGVHFNSGVNNKAVSLMVDGGTFNGKTITALGWDKTAAIYYEVNSNILTSGSDYSDLYYALQQACSNLVGKRGITSGNCAEVKDAVDAVEMNGQPASNFNTDAPYCDGNKVVITKFSDSLENGTGNWTFSNGAYPRWQVDSTYFGPYAQSGLHSLYADDYPGKVTDATARLIPLAIPANAYLRFAQAYDFETSDAFYDGGVLEYSINNGSTWVDASSLIDFNGYTGTIFTGAGNPLSGRSAFLGASHGYISTRLNLASLAGKTVLFRWRMGLDQAVYAQGWWVDNIKMYSCIPFPGAFNKTAPSNGGTGVGLSTTLSWSSSSFADYYQYCYDIINDNQCNRTWNSVSGTSVGISNLGANTTYYWQVRAFNLAGSTDANNQVWNSFTTTSTVPAGTSAIETYVGVTKQGEYSLASGQSVRESYTGVNDGSVKVTSTNAVSLIGAERVIYKVNNVNTSFTEMMALPNGQLDNTYWLPWYNNVDLDTQLRFGNVSGSTAHVHVFIGGVEMTGSPFTLGNGQSTRVSFAGINNGPVQIQSDQNIVAAERVIYTVNSKQTSFSEMMALPNGQLDNTYWLPWYNNVDLDTQLRFGNVSGSTATVHVLIGGAEMAGSPFTLGVGESTRVSFAGINNGPVQIQSDQNIVAAERVIYKVNATPTSFTEMMALPNSQLNTTYWLPAYNNVDLDTQLRFGNVSGSTATVHVFIGGVEMTGSPFTLGNGQSTRVSFAGVNNGPVQIQSDQNIVVAERVIYTVSSIPTSFSEMMALPASQLNAIYWLPWYNNVDLDTQLRFGVP